jgi:hypothetical protein
MMCWLYIKCLQQNIIVLWRVGEAWPVDWRSTRMSFLITNAAHWAVAPWSYFWMRCYQHWLDHIICVCFNGGLTFSSRWTTFKCPDVFIPRFQWALTPPPNSLSIVQLKKFPNVCEKLVDGFAKQTYAAGCVQNFSKSNLNSMGL